MFVRFQPLLPIAFVFEDAPKPTRFNPPVFAKLLSKVVGARGVVRFPDKSKPTICALTPASEIAARLRTAISVFFMVWSGVVVVFSNPN